MFKSSRLMPVATAAVLILSACGSDDDAGSQTSQSAEGSEAAASDGADTDAGEVPSLRMGWGFPGEELKLVMIGKPELFPNIGTCYEPEWQRFNGTSEQVQGMATGTLDGGTVAMLTFPRALDQGVELVMTNALLEERSDGWSIQWTARAGTTLESLKGKKIGTNALGASLDYIVGAYLQEQAGLTFNQDYELVEVPFPQMADALLTGLVDMAPLPQPFYGQFMANAAPGEYETVFTNVEILDPTPQLQNGFSQAYADAQPGAVKCFTDDLAAAAEYVLDPQNRMDVIELTAEVVQIPPQALEPYLLLPERDFTRPVGSAIDVEALQAAWDLFRDMGAISGDYDVSEYLVDGVSITE